MARAAPAPDECCSRACAKRRRSLRRGQADDLLRRKRRASARRNTMLRRRVLEDGGQEARVRRGIVETNGRYDTGDRYSSGSSFVQHATIEHRGIKRGVQSDAALDARLPGVILATSRRIRTLLARGTSSGGRDVEEL